MFNALWRRTTVSALPPQLARRRFASTTPFVPPESLNRGVDDVPPVPGRPAPSGRFNPVRKPSSPSFYTGRASYYDGLLELEDAVNLTRQALKTLQLYPLPRFALDALPPLQPLWKDKRAVGEVIGATLSTSRYRRIITTLNQLNEYKRIAETAGVGTLSEHLTELLEAYEKDNKAAVLARGKRKPVQFDEYGRSYTVGRRKESSARVWVIPVQRPPVPEEGPQDPQVREVAAFLPQSITEKPPAEVPVLTTNIIVNNAPLNEYFVTPTDRERVVRPLKVAGLLGAFNVFAIARGGGTTGQSGAVSLGIAKALAAHVPDVEQILRKAKLMRRDPRMVERKKTNLAKARKAYQWVKR